MIEIIEVKVVQVFVFVDILKVVKKFIVFVEFIYDNFWVLGLDVIGISYMNVKYWFGRNIFGKILVDMFVCLCVCLLLVRFVLVLRLKGKELGQMDVLQMIQDYKNVSF